MVVVAQETPRQEEVRVLLRQSDTFSASLYPAESRHPANIDALAAPDVRFFVARLETRAVGCGALVLGAGHAEIKRVFVDSSARGHGVGRAIVEAIESTARGEGAELIQLETGTSNHEALHLYRRCGYRERGPFGTYQCDPLSVFMEKDI